MSGPPAPRPDRTHAQGSGEAPPPVTAALRHVSQRIEHLAHGGLHRIGRRRLVGLWAVATAVVFAGILVLSVARAPDIGAMFGGLLAAVFFSLMFAAAFGWMLLWSLSPLRGADDQAGGSTEFDALLAPTLRELDAVRADVAKQVRARSLTRVPLAAAGALLFWCVAQLTDDPPGVMELVVFCVIGAVAGEGWAIGTLDKAYRHRYKDRVLPQLAARFGDLTYRRTSSPNLHALRESGVLQDFETATAEDEIAGHHRGLPLSIAEVRLQSRSGNNTRTVFDGLLVDLTLPRALTGTTVIVSDQGLIGNFKARWRAGALERVRLEDPRFEQRFEVYGTDQIESRALLTPAFMERFTALAERTGFSLPGARAEGNRLSIALPKRSGGDLFEPPAYWKPAGGRALIALNRDIKAVLDMADAVIDLDFWASAKARTGA